MASPRGRLTEAQLDLARAFFRRSRGFFLTGGAVLAGWELAHRSTDDLDLFTDADDRMREGESALAAAAAELGGTIELITTSPDFRRAVAHLPSGPLKVDLVRDRAPQLFPKVDRDGVVTDDVREIFVNKVCTLVERSEIRDVVDLLMLERTGLRVEDSLALAQRKDAGVTPATIAWLVASLPLPAEVPGGLPRAEVQAWLQDLERRMLVLAAPR
jgi:hypothetical protein